MKNGALHERSAGLCGDPGGLAQVGVEEYLKVNATGDDDDLPMSPVSPDTLFPALAPGEIPLGR
jgi:hypothetical protein